MTEVIKKLENYNSRMKTAISELERLEYDAEFLDEVARRYWFIVNQCEQRRNYFRGESMEDECKHCSNGYCMVFDCICNGVNLCGVDE